MPPTTRPTSQPGTRRRGAALTAAVYAATLAELAETSFAELSFDKIATRAGTGKAALYRRWRTPAELVLAALTDPVAGFGETAEPRTGSLRTDLLALLGGLAHLLGEPHGQALYRLLSERTRHPQLYARARALVVQPRQELVVRLLAEAAERGEVRPESVTTRIAAVGPRLVIFAYLEHGEVAEAEVRAIVDEVLLPLVRKA